MCVKNYKNDHLDGISKEWCTNGNKICIII
jgi:hypothetical protein